MKRQAIRKFDNMVLLNNQPANRRNTNSSIVCAARCVHSSAHTHTLARYCTLQNIFHTPSFPFSFTFSSMLFFSLLFVFSLSTAKKQAGQHFSLYTCTFTRATQLLQIFLQSIHANLFNVVFIKTPPFSSASRFVFLYIRTYMHIM